MATGLKTQLEQELDAILNGAAIAPLTEANARGFLRITGTDATRWLNGMVTNNIKDLQPGHGNYNFLLNAQGRIVGDCDIYRESDKSDATFLLETDNSQLETVHQTLDRFIIMDDVELHPVEDRSILLVLGPNASALLVATGITSEELEHGESTDISWTSFGMNFVLVRARATSVPTYEIQGTRATIDSLKDLLLGSGATTLSPATLEACRILSGTPRYGVDIRNADTAKDLPQETGQTHALNFNKGCYLGQEIVERIHSRGQVHRQFTAFTLNGSLPTTLPQALEANGKTAGEITSAVAVGDTLYALGYARREALKTHTPLTYPGGTATPRKP